MTSLSVTVGGRWLSLDYLHGDVDMSTVWPGGSDELSFSLPNRETHQLTGGTLVVGYLGPAPVWRGRLTEPDPSQDQLTARGLWRDGDSFLALNGAGNATTVPDTAIDQAISRGLGWTRPTSISSSAASVDVSQGPVTVGKLLDAWAEEAGQRWGVNPLGEVYAKADDTSPTYQTLPMDASLGYTLDGYASTLVGRYFDSGTSTYKTATVTDTAAEGAHGHMEAAVDLTPRGPITTAKATVILNNLLALGAATPKWTSGIELSYGEVFSFGGTPVMLERIAAGTTLRVPDGFDLAWRLQGQVFLDIPIGRTQLSGGTLTVTPLDIATRTLSDAITAALTK